VMARRSARIPAIPTSLKTGSAVLFRNKKAGYAVY
jgi:hypothetical protein